MMWKAAMEMLQVILSAVDMLVNTGLFGNTGLFDSTTIR